MFVAIENRGTVAIEIRTAEIMIIISGRICGYGIINGLINFCLYFVKICFIGRECCLIGAGKSIKPDILSVSRAAVCIESIGNTVLHRDTPPNRFRIF